MVAIAAGFEGGLAVLAWLLGWAFSYPPANEIRWALADVGYAVLWTLPLIPAMVFIGRSNWRPFVRIQQVVNAIVVPLFSGCSVFQLAMISALAGIGEEALFRGFIQNSLATEGNVWGGIIIAGFLFGLAHMITPAYAVLATLMGVYFGWLMHFHDNLLVAIMVHALYDFIALLYLVRINPRSPAILRRSMDDMEQLIEARMSQSDDFEPPDDPAEGKDRESKDVQRRAIELRENLCRETPACP